MRREAAIGIIFQQDKRTVLLIKRHDVPIWVLPGGGIESGESPEEAVVREVWEETGLRVTIIRKTGEYTPLNRLAARTHLFECRVKDGLIRTGCETKEIAYWPLDHLPESFFIVHHDWLADALLQLPSPVLKPIERVTYWQFCLFALRHPLIVLRYLWTCLMG
jgi:8-oxo-dGTP diphosphatase